MSLQLRVTKFVKATLTFARNRPCFPSISATDVSGSVHWSRTLCSYAYSVKTELTPLRRTMARSDHDARLYRNPVRSLFSDCGCLARCELRRTVPCASTPPRVLVLLVPMPVNRRRHPCEPASLFAQAQQVCGRKELDAVLRRVAQGLERARGDEDRNVVNLAVDYPGGLLRREARRSCPSNARIRRRSPCRRSRCSLRTTGSRTT
jgi:hypothetical protein